MAERDAMQAGYSYREMSNKVEQADRSRRRRNDEGTGEVETLRGRADIGRMGDRIATMSSDDKNSELIKKMERAEKKRAKREKQQQQQSSAGTNDNKRNNKGKLSLTSGGQTILDLNDSFTGYYPTTQTSQIAYDTLLDMIKGKQYLGNQSTSILRDAAEEVISILKDDSTIKDDMSKQKTLSALLTGVVSSEQYAKFVQISKNLNDYDEYINNRGKGLTGQGSGAGGSGGKKAGDDVDGEMGVAVVFDESDDEDNNGDGESDIDEDEVVEVAMSSSDEEDNDEDDEDAQAVNSSDDEDVNDDEEHLVHGGKGGVDIDNNDYEKDKTKKKRKLHHDRLLSVHEIDAHYLQRLLSKDIDDADECAKKANTILSILGVRADTSDTSVNREGDENDMEDDGDDDGDDRNKLSIININDDIRVCENKLLSELGFKLFDTIKLLLKNRLRIWSCISMKRATNDGERSSIEYILKNEPSGEGRVIWNEINSKNSMKAEDWTKERMKGITDSFDNSKKQKNKSDVSKALDSIGIKNIDDGSKNENGSRKMADGDAMDIDENEKKKDEVIELDLDSLAFRDGSHTMSNKKCNLPDKSWRAMKKGYEEVHVPASRSIIPKDEKLVAIKELPSWTHDCFSGMDKLNRIQSKMYNVALHTSENILLCAPTGAGKTNVAALTMLNILGQYKRKVNEEDNEFDDEEEKKNMFDLKSFKMVYIAPMKALVQEVVKNFTQRLKSYGITVRELSGDSSLTRQQISETQLIVTTPEKWDIVTRQGEGRAYTQLVKLVIIDEIHLLHDDRGPVLESIVSRIIRQVETTAEPIRLVGLSATLPNYADVATFLRVKPDKGLFFFDHSYRPVPLQMQYVGITERNAFKRFQLQNEICYDKALVQRRNDNQMLIFVHSRAETGKTAKALRDLAVERDELSNFVREGSGTQEILREEAATVKNADLKDVLPYGFAIHHAGMSRDDRELVEDLFADRHIGVLCTTATLAWGVNLPAHAVIIKGTQIYDPSKGRWAELSPLDVLQMLGRAGRPQYDSEGEGIIMTQHSELQYYLSLTNLQLPVESQLIKTLPDHLNAEVVLGTVQTIPEAVDWLSYSFLYIRMLQNPGLYGIVNPEQTLKEDPTLKRRRLDLAHTAASLLEKSHLVRYDRRSGSLQSTPLGRISSQYYISHTSMAMYSRHMRPNMSDIELLRLFSLSGEFAHITVREEEKLELAKLATKVPIPVKESPSEPSAKINILLQAYISRLKLDGFALVSDMAFIQQSAARIMRALFEIALRRNWSALAKLTLAFSNMVAHRIWRSQSPLRQFKNVPEVVARKLERKSDIEWTRYFDLTPSDLGELVGVPKMGRVLHQLVHQFPRLELVARIQPITRSMLRVELILTPAFQFNIDVHGYVQLFHVIVEDVNGDTVLHHEMFSLKMRSDEEEEHTLEFTVPILEPLPPTYFVRVMSDRWLHSESVSPISFSNTILPAKFPPPTELLDLQPLLPSVIGESALAKLFRFKEFNPIQTQTFHELFKNDRSCIVCAPSGSGKTACAEFAIMRMLVSDPGGKCVYVAPKDEIVQPIFDNWKERFGSLLGSGKIVKLTGETAPDIKLLSEGKIVVCTVKQWDALSRRWRQRKAVQSVSLFIVDELHFLGAEMGPTMEVIISRMRFIGTQKEQRDTSSSIRIVGLSASLANAREVGEWMGVPSKSLFNFSPKVRPTPLEIYFQSFDQSNYSGRLMAMAKPVYNAIIRHSDKKPTIIFVPSRRQAQLTAIDIMTYHESQEGGTFLGNGVKVKEMEDIASELRETALQQVVTSGVGFLHGGMANADWEKICKLYREGVLRVLVCPADMCWKIKCVAHLVIIMGMESYDGRERRYVDYPIVDVLHMMGRASRQAIDPNGKCVILCHAPKKEQLKKLLYDPLPIESHLDHYLHDHFNSEIVTKTIRSMQDAVDYVTWTFLYRRLAKNPNYYGLEGTSNVHLSEHLSEMVETVLGGLEESKCCEMTDDGDVSPLNLGMIASYYYVEYLTIELIASSVTAKTKIRGVMEILSAASEFSSLPIRYGEEKTLKILARGLTHKLPDTAQFHECHTKALILLQCHFSRTPLSADLRTDQKAVVSGSVSLIQAIVDVISSNGWLKPALAAMELSQMVVQGLWNKDNILKQIPHFTDEIIKRCEAHEGDEPIESVFDILTLDDDVRTDLLRLPDDKMADVAVFCNNYPNVEVSFEVQDPEDVTAGDPVQIAIQLEREIDEDEMDEDEMAQIGVVSAPLFPAEKREGWWVVVGNTKTNSLLSLKRVSLQQKQKVMLEFIAPEEAGDYNLTLFCMSDSYLGCDQEYSVPLSVAVGESDDESENEDTDDEEE